MALPPGFVVDKLPAGFAVDEPQAEPQPAQQLEQGGFSLPQFGAPPTQADPRSLVAQGATSQETLDERERALAALTPERRALIESINPLEAGLIGAGRGLTTIGRAVGLADKETPFEKQAFQDIEAQQPVAVTTGEILGESAPFIAPGLGIAAIPARGAQIAATAALGATETGLIARGQGADIETQSKAAGIGGIVAGSLDLALPIVGRIGGKIIRKVLGKAPTGAVVDAAGKPSQEFLEALSESGQSFDDIIKEAKDELTKKAVKPREAARKAFLESQGLDPTKAQVTRNAADFQSQQEAAKTSTAVREALEKQDAILTTRFNNKILETGGDSTSQSAAVTDFIAEKATVLDQEIGDLYRVAREVMPDAKNVRFENLSKKLRELSPADRRSGGNISAIIGDMKAKGILSPKGGLIGKVNVETSEDLRKLMNELYDEKNPFGNNLLRQLKETLDDDVFSAAGKDVFNQARKAKTNFERELSRAKISKFDSRKSNLVRDVLENKVDPDQLVDKVIFSKSWRPDDLEQLKSYLSTDDAGIAAFNDMKAEVLQKIKDKSFIGAADEAGMQTLSRDKLSKAINSMGAKKRNILFSKEEQKFLSDMLEVTRIREPVRGTALGRGPSAQAISRIERRLKDIPWLGNIFDVVDIEGRKVLRAKPTAIPTPQARLPAAARAAIPAAAAITAQQEQQ
jgi:hypothetical protein